jgi:hypothetical protein
LSIWTYCEFPLQDKVQIKIFSGDPLTLPTFLGIGVLRGGTTWLYELLASHPEIYVPTRRKEIFFFDLYYERGFTWYESFFPNQAEAFNYKAVGEITATYIYRPYAPERIARVSSIKKLIVSLRNPIDRAYSWFGLMVKEGQYSGSFEAFLHDHPQVIDKGFYSQYLDNYYEYFDKDQILVLVFEQMTTDLSKTKRDLANFLEVATEKFPDSAGFRRVNRSYSPRFKTAYAWARKVAWHGLRHKWNLDWIVNKGKEFGLERLFGEAGPPPPMKTDTQKRLQSIYTGEIQKLESRLQINLNCWK